ncbi:dephospho-CoA kinase [Lactobacillus sp. ESL0681]|uniref:dephospho-CoA kinase n=1 Tax=Lactobacillus sp. ESL0681 TaxID=2983211 RepID=UPI0023F6CB61|nr:dephospho-CoA kinase [Lactobacillus sp. ESL0681]WEV40944.1 dephospho-CoA kinase [Lactobacillus sp. ESL0681]
MTIVLGLTGGIASGKSTADAFFQTKGVPVIDSDRISHDILNIGQEGYQRVSAQFGPEYLNSDQTINRRKLGQLVFNDKQQLAKLNKLTHPLIFQTIAAKITHHKQANVPLIVVDVPLLFEANGQSYCDQTLLIALPESLQLERLMQRDQLTRSAALARINSQMPLAQKVQLADYVIENTGTVAELNAKLAQLMFKLKEG